MSGNAECSDYFLSGTILPISKQLASLANPLMSEDLKQNLVLIINQLFTDLQLGHSCTILSSMPFSPKMVLTTLLKSGLASTFKQTPAILQTTPISVFKLKDEYLIYITKYFSLEIDIVRQIKNLTVKTEGLDKKQYDECFLILKQIQQTKDLPNVDQLHAVKKSINNNVSYITGGPGTGKSTIITLLLWVIYKLYGTKCKVKICAPTGKAASRIKVAIQNSIDFFRTSDLLILTDQLNNFLDNDNFGTIHKLLGAINNSIHFKHNESNLLYIDVLIVDESSMIGLSLYAKLLNAIDYNKIKHVIFLGDKNQLSSVEEGYVFASLVENTCNLFNRDLFNQFDEIDNMSELLISKRNTGDIGVLSKAILTQNIAQVEHILDNSHMIN